VGLADGDVIAGLLLPIVGEDLVVVLVEFPGGIVGDVEQADFLGGASVALKPSTRIVKDVVRMFFIFYIMSVDLFIFD
jgi:hypothetical protein